MCITLVLGLLQQYKSIVRKKEGKKTYNTTYTRELLKSKYNINIKVGITFFGTT